MLNMDNTVVVGGGGRGRGRGTSSMENSKAITKKSGDGGSSNQFPAGLKVLVVDDDPTCLKILERMLQSCLYEVTTCTRAVVALTRLREKKYYYDLVLSDVHMPDMDGFKLLELIGLEMDLPVLMMSVDDKPEVVMKGVTHGACDYLIKPIRIEALKAIWQHVVRKRQTESKKFEQSDSVEDGDGHRRQADDNDYASSENHGSWRNSKKIKEEDDEGKDTSALKKPRVVWSFELHQQFVAAVNQLSIDKAVPKKILELMNVPGLTRENVASHLQKYRLYLKRITNVEPQHQAGLNNPFMISQEANFGPMSSFDGLNFQALSVPSQLPLHTGGVLARSTSTGMQHVDQRKLFEASRLRFGSGKQLRNNNQVNLLHGRPTSIEPKQLNHINHSIQALGHLGQISEGAGSLPHVGRNQGSSLMMQMPQSQLRGPLINGIPMSIGGQQIFSSGINGQVLGGNGTVINGRSATHNPVSHASPMVGFSMNHVTDLSANGFLLGSDAGESSLQSTVTFQGGSNVETKGPGGFDPSYDTQGLSAFHSTYDIFNTLSQNKSTDWELQTVGRTIEAFHHAIPLQGNTDPLSGLGQQGQTSGENGKAMAPSEEVNQHANADTAQCHNDFVDEDSFRAKGNSSSQAMLLPRSWSQDDFYSPFSKQVVESVNEFAQIMKDVSVLVIDQGTIVDRIDYNIQNVSATVEQGYKQLQKADRSQRTGAMARCVTILVIMCLVMLVLLVLEC